jgi:hypothetical protein
MADFIPSRAPWHRCCPKGGEQFYPIKMIAAAFEQIAKDSALAGNSRARASGTTALYASQLNDEPGG